MTKKRAMRGVNEYKEYEDQLNEEEKQFVRQFYEEYHGGKPRGYKNSILSTEEQIKEAYRNYNTLYKDAFNVSRTLNKQQELTDDQREIYELAADESDWELVLCQQGEEEAVQTIMDQAIRDLDAGQNKKVVLSRFYVKMNRLKKEIQRQKRKQK
jgi:nitrogen regulatory protein PII-like uncharacterized protein